MSTYTLYFLFYFDKPPSTSFAKVHVALCADSSQVAGLLATINSVVQAAKYDKLKPAFHIITLKHDAESLHQNLGCMHILYWLYVFDPATSMANLTEILIQDVGRPDLAHVLNFARLYLSTIIPWKTLGIEQLLYLDVDTIVLDNVEVLLKTALKGSTKPVAAAWRKGPNINNWINVSHPLLSDYWQLNMLVMFNAGVLVINLNQWDRHNITRNAEYWIKSNNQAQLYILGSNPPLVLALGLDVDFFGSEWNVDGLGYKLPDKGTLSTGKILHWTGPRKPWLVSCKFLCHVWEKYSVKKCEYFEKCRFRVSHKVPFRGPPKMTATMKHTCRDIG